MNKKHYITQTENGGKQTFNVFIVIQCEDTYKR